MCKREESKDNSKDSNSICPSCGYCNKCGRSNIFPYYVGYPYYIWGNIPFVNSYTITSTSPCVYTGYIYGFSNEVSGGSGQNQVQS